jgi:hypothetical protein
MLLFGHYPGCEAIVRFAERIAARQGTAGNPPLAPTQPQPPRSFAPGGGLLIALCLAQRPPPLAA